MNSSFGRPVKRYRWLLGLFLLVGTGVPLTAAQTTTATLTPTQSRTPSSSITGSITITWTTTPSLTPSTSVTPTRTSSGSFTPTLTGSASVTISFTPTISFSATRTATSSVTGSFTPTSSVTPSLSPTVSFSTTISLTGTRTPSYSLTSTLSQTISSSSSGTPTVSVSFSGSGTSTGSSSDSSTVSGTPSASATSTKTASASTSGTKTGSSTSSSTTTLSATVTSSPTLTVTGTASSTPSGSISTSAPPTASSTASFTDSVSPTSSLTRSYTSSATASRSHSSTVSFTASDTESPSLSPLPSTTGTLSATRTHSSTKTVSESRASSRSSTVSGTGTPSPSQTISESATLSLTISLTSSDSGSVSTSTTESGSTSDSVTITPTPSPSLTVEPKLDYRTVVLRYENEGLGANDSRVADSSGPNSALLITPPITLVFANETGNLTDVNNAGWNCTMSLVKNLLSNSSCEASTHVQGFNFTTTAQDGTITFNNVSITSHFRCTAVFNITCLFLNTYPITAPPLLVLIRQLDLFPVQAPPNSAFLSSAALILPLNPSPTFALTPIPPVSSQVLSTIMCAIFTTTPNATLVGTISTAMTDNGTIAFDDVGIIAAVGTLAYLNVTCEWLNGDAITVPGLYSSTLATAVVSPPFTPHHTTFVYASSVQAHSLQGILAYAYVEIQLDSVLLQAKLSTSLLSPTDGLTVTSRQLQLGVVGTVTGPTVCDLPAFDSGPALVNLTLAEVEAMQLGQTFVMFETTEGSLRGQVVFPKFGGAAFLSPESGGPGSGFGLAVVVVKDDYVTVNAVLYDTDLQTPQMELLLDDGSGTLVVVCGPTPLLTAVCPLMASDLLNSTSYVRLSVGSNSSTDVYQGAVVITSTVDPRPMCSTQLTGGSAVPTNPSLAAGYAMILFSYDRSFALLYGSFHGLTSGVSLFLRGPATRMSTGEELSTFAIARTGVALSRFSLDSELVSFLLSNLVYASLVEAGSVADQLRGQLDDLPPTFNSSTTLILSGLQQLPVPVVSPSVAVMVLSVDPDLLLLEVSMWGLSASPVIAVSLQVQTTSFAFAVLPWGNYSKGVFDIPREGMSALLSGNAAVCAHTTAYPGGEISSLVTLVGHGSRFYVNCLSCPTLLESGLALFAFGSVNYDPLSFTVSISTTDHPANVTSTSVDGMVTALPTSSFAGYQPQVVLPHPQQSILGLASNDSGTWTAPILPYEDVQLQDVQYFSAEVENATITGVLVLLGSESVASVFLTIVGLPLNVISVQLVSSGSLHPFATLPNGSCVGYTVPLTSAAALLFSLQLILLQVRIVANESSGRVLEANVDLIGIAGTNTGVESQFSVALDPSTNISWATTNEFLVVTAKFVCQNCSRYGAGFGRDNGSQVLLVTSPTESLSDGEAAQYIEGVTSVWNLTNLALESPIIHADIERVGSVWSITIIRSIMDPMFPIQSLSFTRFVWACLLGNTSSVKTVGVNFFTGAIQLAPVPPLPVQPWPPGIVIHAALGFLALACFLPFGACAARFLPRPPKDRVSKGNELARPAWLIYHVVLQLAGLVAMLVSIVMPFALGVRQAGECTSHCIIGACVVVIVLIQAGCAAIRPAARLPITVLRWLWELLHKSFGYGVLVLGAATVFTGFGARLPDMGYNSPLPSLYIAFLVCSVLSVCALEVWRRKHSRRSSVRKLVRNPSVASKSVELSGTVSVQMENPLGPGALKAAERGPALRK